MPEAERQSRGNSPTTFTDVRAKIGSAVWVVAIVCVVLLVLGAVLVALKANPDNVIRELVVGAADRLDGPFTRVDGLFTFDGKNGATKSVLVNWGLAAVAYLAAGKLLSGLIRP